VFVLETHDYNWCNFFVSKLCYASSSRSVFHLTLRWRWDFLFPWGSWGVQHRSIGHTIVL